MTLDSIPKLNSYSAVFSNISIPFSRILLSFCCFPLCTRDFPKMAEQLRTFLVFLDEDLYIFKA